MLEAWREAVGVIVPCHQIDGNSNDALQQKHENREIVMGKTSSQQSMGDAVVLALHVVAEFSAELGALFLCEGKKFPVCHDDIIIVHDILNVAEIDDAAAVGHVELRRIQLRIDGVQGVSNHVLCGCGVDNDTPLFGAEKITDLIHTLLDLSAST